MSRRSKKKNGSAATKEIVFHIEGGQGRSVDLDFRRAFHKFFSAIEEAASSRGYRLRIVMEGSRRATFERYCEGLSQDDGMVHFLLVDSEAPVSQFGKPWLHLSKRQGDEWKKPTGATDQYCHLMAQAMEAWFFADPDWLEMFYGAGFQRSSLPVRQNVEEIPKAEHIRCLENATRNTKKKEYHKVRHGPLILEGLNVQLVRLRAPHCDRIFTEIGHFLRVDLSLSN